MAVTHRLQDGGGDHTSRGGSGDEPGGRIATGDYLGCNVMTV